MKQPHAIILAVLSAGTLFLSCASPCSIKDPTCQELCKCTSLECRKACEPAGIDYRQTSSERERYRYNAENESFHVDNCSVRCDQEYRRCLERCKESNTK